MRVGARRRVSLWPASVAVAGFLVELGVVVALMLVYFTLRAALPESVGEATARAADVLRLEQRLNIDIELPLQEWAMRHDALPGLANAIYVWGHFPVIIGIGVWLYFSNRDRYRVFRTALLLSAAVGLLLYWRFPTAPPRLMPLEWGFVDTMSHAGEPGRFLNNYAAVPSYHFGWVFLALVVLFQATGNALLRWAGVMGTIAMFLAIVVTANHFVFDMAAGAAIVSVTLLMATVWQGSRFRRAVLATIRA